MEGFKGTHKPVKAVFAENQCRAIRSSDGLIIRFWKPTKYSGQDERYEQELEETKANQQLVLDAFTVRQQINCDLPELLERHNKMNEWLEFLSMALGNSGMPLLKSDVDKYLSSIKSPKHEQ